MNDGRTHRPAPAGPCRAQFGTWCRVIATLVFLGGMKAATATAQVPLGLTQIPPGVGNPIPRVSPPALPAPGAPARPPPPVTPQTIIPGEVAVTSVVVTGSTAYTTAQLAGMAGGLVGPAIPLSRIEAARVAVLNRYRGDGYLLTTVNASIAPDGRLSFVIVEGRISDVKLDGDIGPAGVQVLRFLKHLTGLQPIDEASLEHWVLLAQEVPGVTLRSVLRPSEGEPGALTLVAQVSRSPLSGLLEADNRAFQLTGPAEGLAVLDLNSFTEFGEQTEFSFYHTSGDTQNFGQVSSRAYVGGSGLNIRVYGGTGLATPAAPLRDIGYHGYTTAFGVSGAYPVLRSRRQSLDVSAYFDVEESEIKADAGASGERVRIGRDSLRVFRIGADYALQDLLAGDQRPGVNALTVRISQGIDGLGGSGNDNLLAARLGERSDFTKATGLATRTQTLFTPWQEASVALKGLLVGQYSGDVLPPIEKFFLGGPEFNRGFYSGQVTGDSGLSATAELQLNTAIDISVRNHPLHVAAQFYAFYDWGETWESQRVDADHILRSIGGGVRLFATRLTEFDLEGVNRITRTPNGTSGSVAALNADAIYWRVLVRF